MLKLKEGKGDVDGTKVVELQSSQQERLRGQEADVHKQTISQAQFKGLPLMTWCNEGLLSISACKSGLE